MNFGQKKLLWRKKSNFYFVYFWLFEPRPHISPGWPRTCYVARVVLQLLALPVCWGSRHLPPGPLQQLLKQTRSDSSTTKDDRAALEGRTVKRTIWVNARGWGAGVCASGVEHVPAGVEHVPGWHKALGYILVLPGQNSRWSAMRGMRWSPRWADRRHIC